VVRSLNVLSCIVALLMASLVTPLAAKECEVHSLLSRDSQLRANYPAAASIPLQSHALTPCFGVRLRSGGLEAMLPGFGDRVLGENDLSVGWRESGGNWFWQLETQFIDAPLEDDSLRLDGSYFGYRFDKWQVRAGVPEQWWGPGYQGSLLLGTNARPVPMIDVATYKPLDPEHFLLDWMGDVHVAMFAGQLESNRVVPQARLLGFRLVMQPSEHWEVGVTRTAQYGGHGRPEDLKSFVYLVLGHDNRGISRYGETLSVDDEPGNQLAGFDVRWKSGTPHAGVAVYAQIAGEDSQYYLPSKNMLLGGNEYWGEFAGFSWRAYLEAAVTSADALRSEVIMNTAYNHSIYRSGYRYRGRVLGHPMDNDGIQQAFGLVMRTHDGSALIFQLRRSRLNRDGGGLNSVSMIARDVRDARLEWKQPWGPVMLGVGFEWLEDRTELGQQTDKSAFLELAYDIDTR